MTEREKMLGQQLYDAADRELEAERLRCKELCYDFNALRPAQEAERQAILRRLFQKTGTHFHLESPFWCDYGWQIEIGENFYANHDLVILDAGGVRFGDHVFLGPHCGFHTSGHPIDWKQRADGLEYAYPITVGDHVWIGAGVQVLPGVTIGSNVVIGGGSVVVRDIPANSVAVGNPCRVIRKLSAQEASALPDGVQSDLEADKSNNETERKDPTT